MGKKPDDREILEAGNTNDKKVKVINIEKRHIICHVKRRLVFFETIDDLLEIKR